MSYATQVSYCCINAAAAVIRGTNGGVGTYTDGLVTVLLIALAGVSRRKYVFSKTTRLLFKLFSPHNVQKSSPTQLEGLNVRYTLAVRIIPTYVYIPAPAIRERLIVSQTRKSRNILDLENGQMLIQVAIGTKKTLYG